uniref:Transporter n=1 Tax=Rhinolophus ferrumequinum TaxID=59479 RepID=A0A671DPG6_RHIFE
MCPGLGARESLEGTGSLVVAPAGCQNNAGRGRRGSGRDEAPELGPGPGPDPLGGSSGDQRPKWDSKLQYLLSCVGFAVGLGNLWRFPYLCQSHGGGAFLIPYFIALFLEGIPLFHIELAIGQRLRRGSVGVWMAISPYLGLGCLSVSFLISLYYNMVLTWVLWYLLNSFQQPLPWGTCPLDLNRTGFVEECRATSTVSYFWYRQTLNVTAAIEHSGSVQWRLLACLAACWAVVYLCVIRGIESTGKAIYFTASFPYLVLTIFLIRGLTLCCVCVLQSASGTGLAFIVFTEAILHMPGSPVWAVLFFSMLFTLGLSSMFGNMEGIITPLLDVGVLPRWVPKEVLTGAACLACFLSATCFTLQSGSYWLEVFDSHAASLNLILFAFFEVVGVAYVYGLDRFCDDIEWMTGRRPGLYWRVTWKVISPLLLLTIFVAYFALLTQTPLSYRAWNPQYEQFPLKQEKSYPGWVWAVCVLLSLLPALWVPGVALAQLLAQRRRKQEDTQRDTRLELQDSGVC